MNVAETHAHTLLRYMSETMDDDGLWTGNMVETFGVLAIPRSYYSPVLGILRGSDAIIQHQRGGGSAPSKWYVINANATLSIDNIPTRIETRRGIEERVADLEALVGGVNVPQVVADILKEVRDDG